MLASFSQQLDIWTTATATRTGTAYRIQVQPGATPQDTFSFDYNLTTLQGTSPTWQVIVEGSSDGTNWYSLVNTAALSATGAAAMDEPATDTPQFVRGRGVAGGTVTNATGVLRIRSTGPFILVAI